MLLYKISACIDQLNRKPPVVIRDKWIIAKPVNYANCLPEKVPKEKDGAVGLLFT